MTSPVLPGEGPMTDETLAAFAATAPERIDCDLWTLLDWALWGAGLADTLRFPMASTMVAAVPAEVRAQAEAVMAAWLKLRGVESPSRTNAELRAELERSRSEHREQLAAKNAELNRLIQGMIDAGAEYSAKAEKLRGELAEARSECAALTAKVEAAEAKAAEWDLTDEQIEMIANDISPLRRAEKWLKLTSYRVCAQALRSALDEAGSGMPHTPAQEAALVDPSEYRCPNCDRWAEWTDGELPEDDEGTATFWCQTCSAETPIESMDSRPQEARGDAGTCETGSGRGTGAREPHTRPQAVVWGQGANCPHRPEWHCETHGECRGCECGCDTVNPEVNEDDTLLASLPVEEGP